MKNAQVFMMKTNKSCKNQRLIIEIKKLSICIKHLIKLIKRKLEGHYGEIIRIHHIK